MQDISISVNFDCRATDAVQLEVDVDGEPILFGVWDLGARWRGRTLKPQGPWSSCCEYDENGCDYLELDLPLNHGYRLQRFFLLDHDDRLLVLGDTLLWDGDTQQRRMAEDNLVYESTLLYSPKLEPRETTPGATELTFYPPRPLRAAPVFRVLPVALPEWKDAESTGKVFGELFTEHSTLLYRLQSSGVSLFAPLVFDLDPDRLKKPYTWRHLTVGENMEKVSEDLAAGYRFQLGKRQFLLYHSMTEAANRTVMGHNLIDDLCFARFDPDTGIEPLVEVQQDFE